MSHENETDRLKEFAKKVQALLAVQQAYFKSKRPDVLEESKRLEREVDEAVKQILNPQRELFE